MCRTITYVLLLNLLPVVAATAQSNLIFAENFEGPASNRQAIIQQPPAEQDIQNPVEVDNNSSNNGSVQEANEIPIARADALTIDLETVTTIAVLDNDEGLTDGPISLVITDPAQNGLVSVNRDNTIDYSPDNGFIGHDQFVYQIVDGNGDTATATVSITVDCIDCISLLWDAHPEPVLGYLVYYSSSSETTFELIADIEIEYNRSWFDPDQPALYYRLQQDLGHDLSTPACFRISAYDEKDESVLSAPVCKVIQ